MSMVVLRFSKLANVSCSWVFHVELGREKYGDFRAI